MNQQRGGSTISMHVDASTVDKNNFFKFFIIYNITEDSDSVHVYLKSQKTLCWMILISAMKRTTLKMTYLEM